MWILADESCYHCREENIKEICMNGQDSCEDVGKEKELFIVIVCY